MNNLPMLPSMGEWEQMKDMANVAIKSGMLPTSIKNAEAALIIMLKGRELNMPPMVAFSNIHVINGKPGISAEMMLAGIYEKYPNAQIQIAESTPTRCVVKARRPNAKEDTVFTWDMERAKKMGLTGKDNYIKQPDTMLKWRAITEMKRTLFPEIMIGVGYCKEELEDSEITKDVTPVKETTLEVKATDPQVQPQKLKNFALKNSDPVVEEVKNEAEFKLPPREEIAKRIVDAGKILNPTSYGIYVNEKVTALFPGKTTQQLTDEEMMDLAFFLESEVRNQGSVKQ